MSIVLVIIGLVIGGVLVGQDLIKAAEVRAQVSQIEKYNSAVNTFREKTGYLPGDMPAAPAAQFGFVTRGQYAGQGDGNGMIEGMYGNSAGDNCGVCFGGGETAVFWVDLSQAGLVDGSFNIASETGLPLINPVTPITIPSISAYMPSAKIGRGNYVYVDSTGPTGASGQNSFVISNVSSMNWAGKLSSVPGLTVNQAYQIDSKVDDGLPQSGNVIAVYSDPGSGYGFPIWAAGGGTAASPNVGANNGVAAPTTAATAGSVNTCYDNSTTASGTPGVNGSPQHYSIEISNGAYTNCALTFKMQSGD